MEEAAETSSHDSQLYCTKNPLFQPSGALLESAVPLEVLRIVPL